MKTSNGTFAGRVKSGEFVITAEYLPPAAADASTVKAAMEAMGNSLAAVSVADNHSGVGISSIAASLTLLGLGVEPIYQVVTRDRNRIALQSDLLGASVLGVRNVLCTSGNHQSLTKCPNSANVYDLDAIQLVWTARQMRDQGTLLDGTPIAGKFSLLIGTVVNPYLKPLDLSMIQLAKKIEAGADFLQTHPVFDVDGFAAWLEAARKEKLVDRTAILAGVLPLTSVEEAETLRATHTDLSIPDAVVARLKAAGNTVAQEKEGLTICAEIVAQLKAMKGVRGLHIVSGGKEGIVQKLRAAAGL
ncbi:MAG TPA: methylenetetrahydrofolate reductase [Sedimentisphaerales bacterium]|nr:methylenetetrahydrofolate reductase [Sedimentisphaerales bacterium]